MNLKIIQSTMFFMGTIVFSSCHQDPVGLETQPKICFKEVQSIIQTNCSSRSGCHGNDSRRDKYITADEILNAVSPYKPYSSEIYTAMTSIWSPMPPDKEHLSKELRTKILLWIEQGADTTLICK